jgi:hypothetical protein
VQDPAPRRQAGVWVVAFLVAMSFVAEKFAQPHRLARPGDLNINTTETMRQRQLSFERWGRPPEDVDRLVFLILAVACFAVTSGTVSALVATTKRAPRRWQHALLFGVAAGGSVIVGGLMALFGAALYLPIAGFAGGCTAGAIVEFARTSLIAPAFDPARRTPDA